MMDIFDRFRHRLIRWLSLGDFTILNGELGSDGTWRPKNLGPIVLNNIDMTGFQRTYILAIGHNNPAGIADMQVFRSPKQHVHIQSSIIRSLPPHPSTRSKSDGT